MASVSDFLNDQFKKLIVEFPGGLEGEGPRSGIVSAVAQVRSLAQELPHAMGVSQKKKRKKEMYLS